MTRFVIDPGSPAAYRRLEQADRQKLSEAIDVAVTFAVAARARGLTSNEVAHVPRDHLVVAAVIAADCIPRVDPEPKG